MKPLVSVVALGLSLATLASAAFGDPTSESVRVRSGDGSISASVHDRGTRVAAAAPSAGAGLPKGKWISRSACSVGGSALCDRALTCQDGTTATEIMYETPEAVVLDDQVRCDGASEQRTPSQRTMKDAFERLALPASPLHIQPGGGRTRVNFDTLFYTTAKPFTRTITLLGRQITFHITPTAYAWTWGDGHTDHTTWPGRPYDPHIPLADDLTHRYQSPATFQARLDTTYTATYTVDGSHPRAVPGTVTIVGTPVSLRADTYTPVLVD